MQRVGQLFKTIDWVLILATILLVVGGITIVFSLTHGTDSHIYTNQIIYAIIGSIGALFMTFIDYRTWRSISWWLYGLTIIALGAVSVIGSKVFGATRWIDFGVFQFQPSELAKLVLIIALARYLVDQRSIGIRQIIVTTVLTALPVGLILIQPDLGSASVLVVIAIVLLLAARIPKIAIGVTAVALLLTMGIGFTQLAPYQRQRIEVFFNPNIDPAGIGYNITQSKIAIGSGGVFGRGLGQGSQSQLQFLPVAHTDFIFAVTAEATGFVGSIVLLLLMATVIVRAYSIARVSQDSFGLYCALGVATLFVYQTLVNVGGNLGLVPVTGIPLPLVSSGGTTTIVMLACIGLLQSIYLRHKKIRFT